MEVTDILIYTDIETG